MSFRFHTLRQEQWIARPIDEVFAFFSEAQNLEAITPPWLGFKILKKTPGPIVQGSEILYALSLHGLPMRWLTEIRIWNPPHRFVDVQRKGPYNLWHHTHTFEAHGDSTRMTDVVRYTLPFGPIGRLVHAVKARSDVETIFAYRRKSVEEVFGNEGDTSDRVHRA